MTLETCCITLDTKTKNRISTFAKKHSISRSAAIRLIINEYFLKGRGENKFE